MNRKMMMALTASAVLANALLGLTSAQAQPAETPPSTPEPTAPATATATPGLRVVNHDQAAPWVGRAGEFPPLHICPEGTAPLVLRSSDHCYGPPTGYEGIVPFPGDADSNTCQLWYARESAAQAAPEKGWDGTWYVAGTQSTVATAAVYCVKQSDAGLVAVDLEQRLKKLEDGLGSLEGRVKTLEEAPPGASQVDLDALDERVSTLEDQADDAAKNAAADKARLDALEARPAPVLENNIRLSVGATAQLSAVYGPNVTANVAGGVQIQVGHKLIWLEGTGLLGTGGHGLGLNLRGSVMLMGQCGPIQCGAGAFTSRWLYRLERHGDEHRFDRIANGAQIEAGKGFGRLDLRLYGAYGLESHETSRTVEHPDMFEAGGRVTVRKDFDKLVMLLFK